VGVRGRLRQAWLGAEATGDEARASRRRGSKR
jgi:hypothetical protein